MANKKQSMEAQIIKYLPGYNCGNCTYRNCDEFAQALVKNETKLSACTVLHQEKFRKNKVELNLLLNSRDEEFCKEHKIKGVIDEYEADMVLDPLDGENSCREVLLHFSTEVLNVGDIIEYRPLGCPVVHYAKILEKENSLLTVHIIGPCKRIDDNLSYRSLGPCMVIAFEGKVAGTNVAVGQTVRFLPNHCMMQKIHSGVIVNLEANKIRIECIDLKVWAPPVVAV
ncbi:hypothetical protein FH5T_00255 [Draconibacterium orientale]|uniref:4Fe-4S domain-containing protein n=2 Tax=Draconibacterium orientale TaxID=1168034 RepID=A0ABM5Q521_9BACT|nr:hypothetical protein FH5T_00255 [Draconibacterium orientale]